MNSRRMTKKPAVAALAPEEPAAAAACGKAAAAGDAEPGAGATAVASHHLKKRPEMARVDSVGLVSNDSLNEEEVEHFFAPEAACEEEERLRKEREERQAAEAAADPPADAALDQAKFSQLEALLNRSQMYTQFLTEQISTVEEKHQEAAEAAAEQKAGGRKRGRGAAGAGPSKKGKPDLEALTQEMCPGFNGALRDYQLKGVKWLISLWSNGLNGILADQMGLGKTVQTIGFLCHLRNAGHINGPYLVLGPLSTLTNWVSEFERWAPDFPVVLYHGTKQERQAIRSKRMPVGKVDCSFPVVVTSYEILLSDIKFMAKYHWKYIVVDEGHRLKNMNCKLIRELKTLHAENKLLLTGTPLQNNLAELWSLLNFLLPDVFSSLENFESWFDFTSAVGKSDADKEILAQEQRNKVVSKLHQILKPFLLRRVKTDVETSLPGKMEVILYAGMSDKQKELNQQLRDRTLNEEMSKMAKGRGGPTVASLNNVLMQMRKNCNHPDLITGPFDGSVFFPSPEELVRDCGKMALLERLLNRLLPNGHKVLIFSQMTTMLDLLSSYLDAREVQHCRIDGSISWQERQEAMKQFNTEDACKVFLLSTRAGGLGINLTAADTCIIYDSDWNPHQDLQAMDRCHRIGQQKPVLVLRLATAHSVEGKMLRRANEKLMLERLVIKKGAFLDVSGGESKASSLKADELLDLLKADISLNDVPQSGEPDQATLDRILDRGHLAANKERPYPESGVGYEVVAQIDGSGLLKGVDSCFTSWQPADGAAAAAAASAAVLRPAAAMHASLPASCAFTFGPPLPACPPVLCLASEDMPGTPSASSPGAADCSSPPPPVDTASMELRPTSRFDALFLAAQQELGSVSSSASQPTQLTCVPAAAKRTQRGSSSSSAGSTGGSRPAKASGPSRLAAVSGRCSKPQRSSARAAAKRQAVLPPKQPLPSVASVLQLQPVPALMTPRLAASLRRVIVMRALVTALLQAPSASLASCRTQHMAAKLAPLLPAGQQAEEQQQLEEARRFLRLF
ncbi:ATP-dependent DNA helicase DDM1 isoform X1 [Chlorella sorokiniana]|uniref:ATP-dependent DNA helicase DDM1 isoform X1 n=1 Tax=Chlorella sorokiniana TaxID=3076 RepID=A0A2P6TDY9_CHLSO|nr:ATP-dependent DNA helicase DDM1 isoform X1 [Chlorella sorokiniana]|eukprot:PRW20842.1 ATP-dependent DNA helicase DDM1 isoform X1 [Chlorella sorokiniana]